MRLSDRVALVTGASRGIGRATAIRLAEEGAKVGVNYVSDPDGKNLADAQSVADEIAGFGGECMLLQADVSSLEEAEKMVSDLVGKFGKIDILVNNAGIVRDSAFRNMSREAWDLVIGVNLTGVFNCTKPAMEHMRNAGYGRIVSISSVTGQMGNFGQANYAAAKAGIIGLTKTLAREGGRKGITVNAIAPGYIMTDMLSSIPADKLEPAKDMIPLGRFGAPEELANAVLFLVSDEASYVSGQVLAVNGGFYM